MIYHNGDRPVNLFEKHNAHQPVGPGHFAERDELSGVFSGFSAMAVGTADEEREVWRALVEVALQEPRKAFAAAGLSPFIEDQGEGFWSQGTGKEPCFLGLALECGLALGFGKISDRQFGNSGLAAEGFEAGLVVEAEGFFRPRL